MAFKITPPYSMDNTPIYNVNMEDGVMGKANKNGTIILKWHYNSKQRFRARAMRQGYCARKSSYRSNETWRP
jgi:hypothetical protein